MSDRTIIAAVEEGGPLDGRPEPEEKAATFVRRLVVGRLRLTSLILNQYELDLRREGKPRYRITVRVDAARRYDFFWANASEALLEERVEDAARAGATAVLLACQLPPGDDRILLWQIDMRELLEARRRGAVPADTTLFKIEPRVEGGWQLRYAGQHVIPLDVTSSYGSVPLAGFAEEAPSPPVIESVRIRGFKSIVDQALDLGRLNVLIGANGSGKSVLVEALGVLGAAVSGRIDDDSLRRRGVRFGALRLYRGAFRDQGDEMITLDARTASASYDVMLDTPVEAPDRTWLFLGESLVVDRQGYLQRDRELFSFSGENEIEIDPARGAARTVNPYGKTPRPLSRMVDTLERFAIFDPQTPILRGITGDPTALRPVGLEGEWLAEAVQTLLQAHPDRFGLMPREDLFELLGWTSDVTVGPPTPELRSPAIRAATEIIRFTDRHLRPESERNILSGYDASEGALYVLFVLTLLFHPGVPPFFAIENVDHTLHPRLARKLVEIVARYVAPAERQIILTAHNPLVLDALPLADDAVRLFAVDRNAAGHTVVRRVDHARAIEMARGLTLSQMWTRGLLGAVPDIA